MKKIKVEVSIQTGIQQIYLAEFESKAAAKRWASVIERPVTIRPVE